MPERRSEHTARSALGKLLSYGVTLAGIGAILYLGLLLYCSAASEDRRLALGEEKSIGGFDPHLHFAVTAVEEPAGWPGIDLAADERLLLVTVRVRSNAARAVMSPAFLEVLLVDGGGGEYPPLPASPLGGVEPAARFADRLAKGESYTRSFLFRLPEGAPRPALWITDRDWLTRFFPGEENSLLHKKVVLELE